MTSTSQSTAVTSQVLEVPSSGAPEPRPVQPVTEKGREPLARRDGTLRAQTEDSGRNRGQSMAEGTTSMAGDTKPIESMTVELHRHAPGTGFAEGTPYIVTAGHFTPVRTVAMPLSQRECLLQLYRLRYDAPVADAQEAKKVLGGHVREILDFNQPTGPSPLQVDLVSNAEELWALPFEACLDEDGKPEFVGRQPPVILTRRIRYAFAEHRPSWPTKPRVLFVHAAPSSDLAKELIAAHTQALLDGLHPWVEPLQGPAIAEDGKSVLELLKGPSLGEIEAACQRNP